MSSRILTEESVIYQEDYMLDKAIIRVFDEYVLEYYSNVVSTNNTNDQSYYWERLVDNIYPNKFYLESTQDKKTLKLKQEKHCIVWNTSLVGPVRESLLYPTTHLVYPILYPSSMDLAFLEFHRDTGPTKTIQNFVSKNYDNNLFKSDREEISNILQTYINNQWCLYQKKLFALEMHQEALKKKKKSSL